jgi:hypothetical protein
VSPSRVPIRLKWGASIPVDPHTIVYYGYGILNQSCRHAITAVSLTVPNSPPGGDPTFANTGCETFNDLIPKANTADGDGYIRFNDNYCEFTADASIPEIQLCDTPIAILSFTR